MSKNGNDIGELREVLDTVADKIPRLLSNVLTTLYSADSGRQMGQSIGSLYRELVDAGIPKEDALEMAKSYMISISSVLNDAMRSTSSGATSKKEQAKPHAASSTPAADESEPAPDSEAEA